MKLILTFMLMLLAVSPSKIEEFNSTVHDGYLKYEVLEEKTNAYYTYKIILGINKDKMNFGVFLFNETSKSHKLMIEVNGKPFEGTSNSRGDYIMPAIEMRDDVTIYITDGKNTYNPSITIKNITVEDFNLKTTNIITGGNNGLSSVRLKAQWNFDFFTLLIYVFAGLIFVFGGIIIYMFFGKKGIFSTENRKADVFNYREYVNNYPSQDYENNIVLDERDIAVVEDTPSNDIPEETPIVNMYPYQREYDDDDEDFVKELLQQKGFNTEYVFLSENEKNLVMLELMKMRDLKEINREQYQKEIIDLWKK